MGSFRSQPDNTKHSIAKEVKESGFSYAVTHMCGTLFPTQDGASTWKTHTSLKHNSPTPNIPCSLCSMATEVTLSLRSGAEVSTFVERHFIKELEANDNYKKENY